MAAVALDCELRVRYGARLAADLAERLRYDLLLFTAANLYAPVGADEGEGSGGGGVAARADGMQRQL